MGMFDLKLDQRVWALVGSTTWVEGHVAKLPKGNDIRYYVRIDRDCAYTGPVGPLPLEQFQSAGDFMYWGVRRARALLRTDDEHAAACLVA